VRLDLSRRTDGELLREFRALVLNDRRNTAELLAYIGEIQARGLFRDKGYASMFKYCVNELYMSEGMAWKRTQVARLARSLPVILDMIADGRLHLTAVVRLLPHRLARDFDQLLEAAAHKTKSELEQMLVARFPQPDARTVVAPLVTSVQCQELVPEPVVGTHVPADVDHAIRETARAETSSSTPAGECSIASGLSEPTSGTPAPLSIEPPVHRARVQPLAPQRFAIQVTVGQATHDKLRRAQDLLGHQVAPGDLDQVLDRALDCLIRQLEHRKFAATERPRRARSRSTEGKRHVPAHVKRAVYQRDGGQCTFVGDSGRRCDERRDLEYDHVEPFARGGEATVAGLRLLCRTHNQFEAERTYGAGFMDERREQARSTAEAGRPSRCGAGPPV
jgi:5-methylcytosine-specific restriction endonuclease McrA